MVDEKKIVPVSAKNVDPFIPDHRVDPEWRVNRVTANDGMVTIEITHGNESKVEHVTRSEALRRARAVNEMIPYVKYADERQELQNIVEQYIEAIAKAKAQAGGRYTSTSVSMALTSMDPGSPLNVNGKTVAKGH